MALRDAYFEGASGLTAKLLAAHDAGVALVGAAAGQGQYNAIVTGLEANAALGLKEFTVSITTTYNPAALRNNGGDNLIIKAYLSGVSEALSSQHIYDYECTPALNADDPDVTKIDLNFTF